MNGALRNEQYDEGDVKDFVVRVESHVTVSMERRASGFGYRDLESLGEEPRSDIEWPAAWKGDLTKGP